MSEKKLIAYCLKTKQKEEMVEATIVKTKRGGYMAKGVSKDGHKMSLMMSEENALKAIDNQVAKKEF
jgi:hypothetical protein